MGKLMAKEKSRFYKSFYRKSKGPNTGGKYTDSGMLPWFLLHPRPCFPGFSLFLLLSLCVHSCATVITSDDKHSPQSQAAQAQDQASFLCDLGPLFFLLGTQLPYHKTVRWHPNRAFRLFVVAVFNSGNHFSDNNVQGIPTCKTDAGGMGPVLSEWRVRSALSSTQPPLHLFTDTLKVSL